MSRQHIDIDWTRQRLTITNLPHTASPPADAVLQLQVAGHTIEGQQMKYLAKFMTLVTVALAAVADAAGNPIALEALGALTWGISDESIATLTVNGDGTVTVNPTGKAGTVQVTVQGDSDPNTPEGFAGLLELTYLPGEANTVTLQIVGNPDVTQV